MSFIIGLILIYCGIKLMIDSLNNLRKIEYIKRNV
jgi:hypothetical protein